jgi:hypothetical protein
MVNSEMAQLDVDQTPNPADEYPHPIREDSAWSESYYFYFVDPKTRVSAFTRMGFRSNEGWADGLNAVYFNGRRVAFCYGRRELPKGDQNLKVGGLEASLKEPFRLWSVSYEGAAQDIPDGRTLVAPRKDRPQGWFSTANVSMQVDFTGVGNPYYFWRGEHGHFEQVCEIKGDLRIGDETHEIKAWGLRDKSWGSRSWQSQSTTTAAPRTPPRQSDQPSTFTIWLTATFGADLAFAVTCVRDSAGVLRGQGFLQRNQKNIPLLDAVIESEYEPDSVLQQSFRMNASAADGTRFKTQGIVFTVCPTKIAMPGGATLVNEGVAEFDLDGRKGFGIAEYWVAVKRDQV